MATLDEVITGQTLPPPEPEKTHPELKNELLPEPGSLGSVLITKEGRQAIVVDAAELNAMIAGFMTRGNPFINTAEAVIGFGRLVGVYDEQEAMKLCEHMYHAWHATQVQPKEAEA